MDKLYYLYEEFKKIDRTQTPIIYNIVNQEILREEIRLRKLGLLK